MPCTLSTQKRARLAPASAPMSVMWTSLPPDQVRSVGDCLLANNDIDDYMAFRAVCKDWRFATKDDNDTNPATRFVPTKCALLDRCDDIVTLVNVDTGRFLSKRIPSLHHFFFIGATSGGAILLAESEKPHRARVLNPFTGSIAYFEASIPSEGIRAVAMTTEPPLTVFISTEMYEIMWADQSMASFKRFKMPDPTCITSFKGNLYATDRYGSILSTTFPAVGVTATATTKEPKRSAVDITIEAISSPIIDIVVGTGGMMIGSRYYLVDSAGDLLLVTKPLGFVIDQPVVRRVNTETRVIEPVSSIGSRAIFVSHVRCLSIDADKFPSIQGGCVYFLPSTTGSINGAVDRTVVRVADNFFVEFARGWGPLQGFYRPFTLDQVITNYCRSAYHAELHEMMMNADWDGDTSSDDSESDESSSSELDGEELSSSEDDDEASSSEPVAYSASLLEYEYYFYISGC